MSKRIKFYLLTGLYIVIGSQLCTLAFIIISGNLFGPSLITKTASVIFIYLFTLSYFYLIPYRLNKTGWSIVILILIAFTIFSYTYPFKIAIMEN